MSGFDVGAKWFISGGVYTVQSVYSNRVTLIAPSGLFMVTKSKAILSACYRLVK